MLTYSVKALSSKRAGASESHTVNEAITLEPSENLQTLSRLTGKVTLIKLEHEISVRIENFEIDIEARCAKCLKKFSQHVSIPLAEREFIIDLPEDELLPGEDYFMIDKKTREISLLEMVRQEILLHFPPIPVCSKSCKGLCGKCGNDLNNKECGCVRNTEIPKDNPFKKLKSNLIS